MSRGGQLTFDQRGGDDLLAQNRALLVQVSICLKLTTTHELGNEVFDRPVAEAVALINSIMDEQRVDAGEGASGDTDGLFDLAELPELPELPGFEGRTSAPAGAAKPVLALQAVGENFFVNREIVKLDSGSHGAAAALRAMLRRIAMHEVWFEGRLRERDLMDFLAVFQRHYRSQRPTAIAEETFSTVGLRLIDEDEASTFGAQIDPRRRLLRAFAVLAVTLAEVGERMKAGRSAGLAGLRRTVHELLDAANGLEATLVGLTQLDELAEEPAFHQTATTALALLMGKRLGLARPALTELGLAAAMHDVGRIDVTSSSADGWTAQVADDEWRRVPLTSVIRICQEGLHQSLLGRAAVAWEHQLGPQAPQAPKGGVGPSTQARLVAVASAFTLLVTPPPPRAGLTPERAVKILLAKAGTRFDPLAVRLLVSVIGLLPVGTMVRLSDGRVGAVVGVPAYASAYSKPPVRVVRDAEGKPMDELVEVANPLLGVTIVQTLDPFEAQVHLATVLLA